FLSVGINISYLGGSSLCIFFLSPVLLLLNDDQKMMKGLTEQNRYFPVTSTISIFLILSAIYTLMVRDVLLQLNLVAASGQDPVLTRLNLAKNLVLLSL